MKLLRSLILVLLLGICVGCETSLTNMTQVGDFTGVAQNFKNTQKPYRSLDTHNHYMLCGVLLTMRKFTSFLKCHEALSNRFSGINGPVEPLQFHGEEVNKSWEIVALNSLAAQAYLELGDNKKAIKLAEAAVLSMNNEAPRTKKKRHLFDEGKQDLVADFTEALFLPVTVFTIPLLNSLNEGAQTGNLIPLLGVLAVAHARNQDAIKAREYVSALNKLNTGSAGSGAFDATSSLWQARALIELKSYEDAYTAMNSEQWGAGRIAMKAFMTSAYLNPAWYAVMPFEYGTINQDDLMFTTTFEPSFLKAKTALLTNRYEEANQIFGAILSEPKVKGFGFIHYGALHGKGLVNFKQGRLSQAIQNFEAAIEVIEAQRSSLNTDQYKIGFVGDKQTVYWDLVQAYIKTGRIREAFQRAEQAKARALVDMLASRKSFAKSKSLTNSETMLAQLRQLEIESLKLTSKDQEGIKLRSAKIRTIKNQIARTSPELASLTTIQPSRLDVLQTRLRKNETLLEYYGNKNDLLAFVVTKNSVTVSKLQGTGLSKSVKNFRRFIEKKNPSFSNTSKQLYRRLISPIAQKVKGRNLTIVPHGPLHYLPFAALKGPKGYLLQNYNIRILPSASVLEFLQTSKSDPPPVK